MTTQPRIALIGECMIELQHRADGSLHQSFGGDTLNAAVYLRRELGDSASVDYVTALGDDSFSDAMCKHWAEEGLGLGLVQRLPDPHDARARRVCFTPTGLDWLRAFEAAVAQAEAEWRAEVGDAVATVVSIGLETYASGASS